MLAWYTYYVCIFLLEVRLQRRESHISSVDLAMRQFAVAQSLTRDQKDIDPASCMVSRTSHDVPREVTRFSLCTIQPETANREAEEVVHLREGQAAMQFRPWEEMRCAVEDGLGASKQLVVGTKYEIPC